MPKFCTVYSKSVQGIPLVYTLFFRTVKLKEKALNILSHYGFSVSKTENFGLHYSSLRNRADVLL